jgi:Na+/melibiose symporter-like transporter
VALAAIFALYKFKEPVLHEAEPLGNVREQIRETFRSVFGKRSLLRIVVTLLLVNLGTDTLYEFSQLWFIEANTPQNLFGPIYAVVLSTSGIGGYLAGRTKTIAEKQP